MWYVRETCFWHAFCSLFVPAYVDMCLACLWTCLLLTSLRSLPWHGFDTCLLLIAVPAYLQYIYCICVYICMCVACMHAFDMLAARLCLQLALTWHVACSLLFVWVLGSASSVLGCQWRGLVRLSAQPLIGWFVFDMPLACLLLTLAQSYLGMYMHIYIYV